MVTTKRSPATLGLCLLLVAVTAPGLDSEAASLYDDYPEQLTLQLPEGWTAYDQSRLAGGELGYFNVIIFSPLRLAELMKPTREEAALQRLKETMGGLSTGEIACFTLNRHAASKGMTCGGFTAKGEKKVLKMVRESSLSRQGIELIQEPRTEPIDLGGCRGLRVTASWRTPEGSNWKVDTRAVSDGEILYLFFVRALADHFERNRDILESALVDLRLSAAG